MLKALDQHNKERREHFRYLNSNKPRLNGLACPNCGKELVDSNPNMLLTSNPPQKNVKCQACEYVGYRVA